MFSNDNNRLKGKTTRTESCFSPLSHRQLFHGWGTVTGCSDSQKNVMFNEPNMEIIMPLIFGTHKIRPYL